MKCAVVFLVSCMVVLMAEPGECIWGTILHGGIVFKEEQQAQQRDQQLDRRARVHYERRFDVE
uniref:Uncharacterized protein n=1 Tax=Amphilophus citrinellus TaxID=61819 RepID=A0A3Q0RD56_AMPCI